MQMNMEGVGLDIASFVEDGVRDQPDPPRKVKLRTNLAFYDRRREAFWFLAFAAIAALPAIAVLQASGPQWLRIAICVVLIGIAVGSLCAPALAAILLTHMLRQAIRAKGRVLSVVFVSGSGFDHASTFARGSRAVEHPRLGMFEDTFDIRWRWSAPVRSGAELELLVDLRRKKVLFTLGISNGAEGSPRVPSVSRAGAATRMIL
jgi:hypothetical protein